MNVDTADLISPLILVLLAGGLTILFLVKRKKTQVNALDWFIISFFFVTVMGILQLFKLYFIDDWLLFKYASNDTLNHSLPVDPVRFFHLLAILVLFLMAEQFLSDSMNSVRMGLMSGLLSIYLALSIYFVSTGKLIYADEIWPFLEHHTIDSLVFDTIQMIISMLLLYVYVKQYTVTDSKQIKFYLGIISLSVVIFAIASVLELLEVFFTGFDVSGFLSTIPTLLILAYFYTRYPNFVYLTPSKIMFLQIVSSKGQLLYAAELKDTLTTSDFLIAPSLTSVNTILGELVGKKDLQVSKMNYNGGLIIFERIGDNIIILQTDRPAGILKRSMRYFLRVFNKEFNSQIIDFKGFIDVNDKNISPDDVLRQCIPIVQAKALTSSYHRGDQKNKLPKVKTLNSTETEL